MKPCSTCPWRCSAPLGYWHPARLIAIAYVFSADAGLTAAMGCHEWNGSNPSRAPQDSPPCGGWVRVARDVMTVRALLLRGEVSHMELQTDTADLFSDVTTMLRWNGIDVDRLPPLRAPVGADAAGHLAWRASLRDLRATLRDNPEAAHDFVLPGSPMAYGLDEARQPRIPKRRMAAWLRACRSWSASRAAAS